MTTLLRAGPVPAELRAPGFSQAASNAIGEWRGDPDWVRALRAEGWAAWETIPMPTPTTEGWRRTNLRFLAVDQVYPAAQPARRVDELSQLPAALVAQLDTSYEEGGLLVQQDGATAYGALADALRAQGVIFTDMHTALREQGDLLQQFFMRVVPARWQPGMPSNAGKFEALNAAFFNGGSFVYVPPNTTVTLPLRSVVWSANPRAGFFPRSVVVVDRGSKLVYQDEYRSVAAAPGAPPVFGSGVVEVYVGDGARLDYLTMQDWSLSTTGFITQRTTLGSDAHVNWVVVSLGGQYTRSTVDVLLQGKGGKADMLGLSIGEGTQAFDLHTYQDHLSPYTDSDQLYKTAMRHRSRLVYEGMINIRPGSYGSNGYQANRNLLLDETAKADSIPMLEISDNDVRCTHGSSVGPIEEEHVYYLMSRGIARPVAEQMIVEGFFEPVISRIAVEETKDTIRNAVRRKIGQR